MLECFAVDFANNTPKIAERTVTLNFDQRQKSRGQAVASDGEKVAWFIERGVVLADGDVLISKHGERVRVLAAAETLSEVVCADSLLLTRAAYHLGNRHVPLQIEAECLSFQHDHVLDDMLRGLGLQVNVVERPFHPESGAYHKHSNQGHSHHGHSHHSHSQHNHSDHDHSDEVQALSAHSHPPHNHSHD